MNTDRLTCQICARAIKAKRGIIAHHGYLRPGHGWQTSSCLGARYAPLEVSRDRIKEVVDTILKPWLVRTVEARRKWLAEPPETITEPKRISGRASRTFTRPEGYKPDPTSGSCSPGTYDGEFISERWRMERTIKDLQHDIKELERRYAEWKPA